MVDRPAAVISKTRWMTITAKKLRHKSSVLSGWSRAARAGIGSELLLFVIDLMRVISN